MKLYRIGFDIDGKFNGIASAHKLRTAKELAKEIEQEYSEKPIIKKEEVNLNGNSYYRLGNALYGRI